MTDYVIEQRMLHGWENCSHTDQGTPMVYASPARAQSDLQDHFAMLTAAGMQFEVTDFRIRPAK